MTLLFVFLCWNRPWQLLPLDEYTFNLSVRPPTKTLDHLTSYLEVKYADVLLRKDAVQTLQRQLAVHSLSDDSSSHNPAAAGSEAVESPPAALTAGKTLSPAEREGIIQALDDLLERHQYQQYRDVVLQLYCDGLVSWSELQQCWAAAEAGQELEAAEKGPVKFAGMWCHSTATAAAVINPLHVCDASSKLQMCGKHNSASCELL